MKLLLDFTLVAVVGFVTTMRVTVKYKLTIRFTGFLGAGYISFVVLDAVKYLL